MQGEELRNVLTKVKGFIPEGRTEEIEFKVNQIDIDLSPWMGNCNIQENLEMIKTALTTLLIMETGGYVPLSHISLF